MSEMPTSRAKTAYGLLSEIRRLILAEPKRYDQGSWLSRGDEMIRIYGKDKAPRCGTVGCVAGWTVALKKPSARPGAFGRLSEPARQVLGLSLEQAFELFDGDAAGDMLTTSGQTRKHARAGARHIARFQQRYAAQLKAKKV